MTDTTEKETHTIIRIETPEQLLDAFGRNRDERYRTRFVVRDREEVFLNRVFAEYKASRGEILKEGRFDQPISIFINEEIPIAHIKLLTSIGGKSWINFYLNDTRFSVYKYTESFDDVENHNKLVRDKIRQAVLLDQRKPLITNDHISVVIQSKEKHND